MSDGRALKVNNPWKQAEAFFDQKLKILGLSKEQIEAYTSIGELEDALQRINDCIQNVDQFAKFSISSDASIAIVGKTTASAEFGALPVLLERKKLITDRIRTLSQDKEIDKLKNLMAGSDMSVDIQGEALDKLDKLLADFEEQKQEKEEIDQQIRAAELDALKKREDFEREMTRLKERSKVWLSFLARESVASMVGALLLIIITIAQLIAMHPNVETTEILNNSFLVILGYFFGQAVNKGTSNKDE